MAVRSPRTAEIIAIATKAWPGAHPGAHASLRAARTAEPPEEPPAPATQPARPQQEVQPDQQAQDQQAHEDGEHGHEAVVIPDVVAASLGRCRRLGSRGGGRRRSGGGGCRLVGQDDGALGSPLRGAAVFASHDEAVAGAVVLFRDNS